MDPPKELNRLLRSIGGESLSRQPVFRLVWGGSRLAHFYSMRGGCYERRPKYLGLENRWIVEMLQDPGMGKEQWDRIKFEEIDGVMVDVLGDYPSMGEYEILYPIQTPHTEACQSPVRVKGGDGECECGGAKYLGLTAEIVQKVTDIVKLTKQATALERKHALLEREENKQIQWEKEADDIIRDAQLPFGGNYFVPMKGKSPDYWPKDPKTRFVPS